MANPIEKIDLLSRENVEVLQAVNEEGEECNSISKIVFSVAFCFTYFPASFL